MSETRTIRVKFPYGDGYFVICPVELIRSIVPSGVWVLAASIEKYIANSPDTKIAALRAHTYRLEQAGHDYRPTGDSWEVYDDRIPDEALGRVPIVVFTPLDCDDNRRALRYHLLQARKYANTEQRKLVDRMYDLFFPETEVVL